MLPPPDVVPGLEDLSRARPAAESMLVATADTFVMSGYPDENWDGYDMDFDPPVIPVLWVGYFTGVGNNRVLLKFDLSSIPQGSTITSAELGALLVAYWKEPEEPTGPTIQITSHRLTSDWGESTVTWNTAPALAESYGSASVGMGEEGADYYWDVTSLVQSWVDGTYANYGLMLKGPDTGSIDMKAFVSREQVGFEPALFVQYQPPPAAEFTATPTSGVTPLDVQFTDQSTGNVTSWEWDFDNNGVVDSTEQNPLHTYAAGGVYTVSLTATNPMGSNTQTKADYVTAEGAPVADFSADPDCGLSPLDVQFTDLSLGDVTTWDWDFGDSETSTEQSPSHIYVADGTYTVTLTAGNQWGTDTEIKTGYIRAGVVACVHTLSTGWNMFALPVSPQNCDFSAVLGDDIAEALYVFRYDPAAGGYQMWSTQNHLFDAELGCGYWVKVSDPTEIDAEGFPTGGQNCTIHLSQGWNMIGHPFDFSVDWGNVQVSYGETTLGILGAHDSGWVLKYLYGYNSVSGGYEMATAPDGQLDAWYGYWVRALVECDMIIPTGSMVSYWNFDEGSGSVAQDCAGDNDGTILGATWTTGVVGNAMSFDGDNDYVEVSDNSSLDITDDITIEAWVKFDVLDIWHNIMSKEWASSPTNYDYCWGFTINGNDNKPELDITDISGYMRAFSTNTTVNTGIWYHIAYTYDGANVRAYLNGELKSTTAYTDALVTSNDSLFFGKSRFAGVYNIRFDGILDEVAIYDFALPPDEIERHYQDGLSGIGYQ
ncbi:DNRLRE domain-containing protein [Chloroflexota bacterium]